MTDGLIHSFSPDDIQSQGLFIRLVDWFSSRENKYSEKKTLYFIRGHAHLTQTIIFLKLN